MSDNVKKYKPYTGGQENFVCSNCDIAIYGGIMGCQPASSIVITPFGERKVTEIEIGSIITASDGGQQRVIDVNRHEKQHIYEFEFADGRKVQSGEFHLWNIRREQKITKKMSYNKSTSGNSLDWSVWNTKMIVEYMDNPKHKNYQITVPLPDKVQFSRGRDKISNTIHPYLLGVLLGGGCITGSSSISYSGNDLCIAERIRNLGYAVKEGKGKIGVNCLDYYVSGKNLKEELVKFNIYGTHSDTKFIPKSYKFETIENRLDLLRGLFDTNGFIDTDGNFEYTTTSEQLAKDIQYIIWSLGGYASITTKDTHCKKNGETILCKKAYRLYVVMPKTEDLFYLKRRLNRVSDHKRQKVNHNGLLTNKIVSYKYIGYEEVFSITVDSPDSLYLTDNYIVTHNSGKTAAAVMLSAEPSMDSNFTAVYLRNNLKTVSAGGGLVDEFSNIYGSNIHLRESGTPNAVFPSGAKVVFEGMNNQNEEDVEEKTKGWQYDLIYFDELTGFEWFTFAFLVSRNRGTGKWTGKIRGTCNPKKSHWLRTYLDWYIGVDGYINPERDGVVRFFFQAGDTVEDLVWGSSKKEVYNKCKIAIDDRVKRTGGTWDNYILSSVFYQGHISENKAVLGRDSSYLGKVSLMGSRKAQANLEGNWNVDPNDDSKAEIPSSAIRGMLISDPLTNGDRWITADIADEGSNNMVVLVWDGFHVIDSLALYHTTPKENADNILSMATKHQVGNKHIIFDATAARYILDYIPGAIPYISQTSPIGMYSRTVSNLKSECFKRLVSMINKGMITISKTVAEKNYPIKNPRNDNVTYIAFFTELMEECKSIRFVVQPGGKERLATKNEMKKILGKGRSTDVVDTMAMRMYPVLGCEYGAEFEHSLRSYWEDDVSKYDGETIYDVLND